MNAKPTYNLSTYVDIDNLSAGKDKKEKTMKFSLL